MTSIPTIHRTPLTHPRGPGRPGEPLRIVASEASREPGARRNRGAPPRGVDVKQPPAGAPGAAQGPGRALPEPPGAPEGSPGPGPRIRDLGIRGSLARDPRPGAGEGPPGTPGPASRGVLHQPLAAGPRGTRRGSRDRGSPGTGFRTSREAPASPPPQAGLQTPLPDPRGTAGVGSPRRGRRGLPSLLPEEAVSPFGDGCRRSGQVKG